MLLPAMGWIPIVLQKEKFASNPKNYAMAKARWMKEKEIAIWAAHGPSRAHMYHNLNWRIQSYPAGKLKELECMETPQLGSNLLNLVPTWPQLGLT